MGLMKAQRNALNRGTAVYVGGSDVRFIWACDCTRVETVTVGRKKNSEPMSPELLKNRLVPYWRRTGVTLPQCKRHPDFYSPISHVARLNQEHRND